MPLVFWSTIFIGGIMTQGYSHLKNYVSELGMRGTTTQYLFTAGLVLGGILTILFVVGLIKTSKSKGINTIPLYLLFFWGVSMAGAGLFPGPSDLHSISGLIGFPILLSPILALILWRKTSIPKLKLFGFITLFFFALSFLGMIPETLENYPGLLAMFAHSAWSIWFIYLSFSFLSLEKNNKAINKV